MDYFVHNKLIFLFRYHFFGLLLRLAAGVPESGDVDGFMSFHAISS